MPTFSVIIPVYNRPETVLRAIRSVFGQTHKGGFEVIVVDDGSTDGTAQAIHDHYSEGPEVVNYIRHDTNRGRMAARNTGAAAAKNDWLLWLDSDDELITTALSHFAEAIKARPDTLLFTAGALVYNDSTKYFTTRGTFVPQKGEMFRSGQIGSGSFCFHRSINVVLPESLYPYGGEGSFSAMAQKQWPELQAIYGQNEEGQWKPIGNPNGDDAVAFFVMTRNNQPVGISLPLYLQHVRA